MELIRDWDWERESEFASQEGNVGNLMNEWIEMIVNWCWVKSFLVRIYALFIVVEAHHLRFCLYKNRILRSAFSRVDRFTISCRIQYIFRKLGIMYKVELTCGYRNPHVLHRRYYHLLLPIPSSMRVVNCSLAPWLLRYSLPSHPLNV